jgi:hypothetical protein
MDVLKRRDDAPEKLAGLVLNAEFLERPERLPARGLVHPAPSAFADMTFRDLRIDGPRKWADMTKGGLLVWSKL